MVTKVIMPKLGFDMSSGKVVRWLKQVGDTVRKNEPLLEIETDKATVEIEATSDGVLGKILAGEGSDVPVGETVGEIADPGEAPAMPVPPAVDARPVAGVHAATTPPASAWPRGTEEAAPTDSAKAAVQAARDRLDASPLAKRLAAEFGIDLRQLKGSGPSGRITKEDVEAYQMTISTQKMAVPAVSAIAAAGEQPLSRMRQTIARRMAESKGPVPQFHLTTEVDVHAALALVRQLNDAGKGEDLRVSPMTLVMKACAMALRTFPSLNASFAGDRLILHEDINVGVAVAVEGGLLTPVISECDKKSVAQIARESRSAAERARSGKLNREDLTQGTFTVSNLGMFGIDHFIAIVNPPEAAIMAIGTAKEVPVIENGQVKVGTRMMLTLSADHRVTDGAEAARFLAEVKRLLQSPMSLFL